jgi:hypothetical protein
MVGTTCSRARPRLSPGAQSCRPGERRLRAHSLPRATCHARAIGPRRVHAARAGPASAARVCCPTGCTPARRAASCTAAARAAAPSAPCAPRRAAAASRAPAAWCRGTCGCVAWRRGAIRQSSRHCVLAAAHRGGVDEGELGLYLPSNDLLPQLPAVKRGRRCASGGAGGLRLAASATPATAGAWLTCCSSRRGTVGPRACCPGPRAGTWHLQITSKHRARSYLHRNLAVIYCCRPGDASLALQHVAVHLRAVNSNARVPRARSQSIGPRHHTTRLSPWPTAASAPGASWGCRHGLGAQAAPGRRSIVGPRKGLLLLLPLLLLRPPWPCMLQHGQQMELRFYNAPAELRVGAPGTFGGTGIDAGAISRARGGARHAARRG